MIDAKTTIGSNNVYYFLKKYNIQYRQFALKDDNFLFCTLPNGLTFDILIKQDEIKLWRFVGTTSVSKAGIQMEYRSQDIPYTVLGFEVTDEGDICFYAKQKIDYDDFVRSDISDLIGNYIKIAIDLIASNNVNR